MSLPAGARLGPYEIVSPLGAGGMGEVYRAKDGRLNRTVAIKVLPQDSAADADRRERFEREAKAISALDHPNICALYDVGEEGGTYFLVMPCLEGHTLAERLTKGALPVDQAIKHAIEIATALDAAHRRGIVHRDLKPANVMLTKTGVKLLDFGLAKLKKAAGPLGDTTMTKGTGAGTLLGTMPYMSPEQIEGRDVDARSDIFALGAVIHEMIAGERAFKGDSAGSVIGAILKDVPPALSAVQPLAPAALDHLVATCLAKDPDERWQSAADIGRELRWIAAAKPGAAPIPPRRAWTERIAWTAVTIALVAALAWQWRGPAAAPANEVRLFLNPPPGTTFAAHLLATLPAPQFAISPDGRAIAFVAAIDELRSSLWVRPLASLEAQPLPGTDAAQEPFWSPDSRWIGFFDQAGSLKRVSPGDGTVQTIATGVSDGRGASWGMDETILFGTGSGPIYEVPASGGQRPREVTTIDRTADDGSHRWPQWLPGNTHFLFTVRSGSAERRGIQVMSRDGSTTHHLSSRDSNMQFVPPNTVLFLDGDTLLAQSLDLRSRQLTGPVTPIAAHVGRSTRGHGAFSMSADGTLAYAAPVVKASRLTWLDRSGKTVGTAGPEGEQDFSDFRLSPDESRLAATIVEPTASVPDVWITDLARGGTTRFTFGPILNAGPIWSPDGTRIAFRTNFRGITEIYSKSAAAGSSQDMLMALGRSRRTGMESSSMNATDWSRDGKHLVVSSGQPADLWLVQPAADGSVTRIVDSPGDQMHANLSPDGRFVAYTSTESGRRFDVYVQPLSGGDRKSLISTDGGYEPRWRADGREIYYLARDGTLMAVTMTGDGEPSGTATPLFRTEVDPAISSLRAHYVPNKDGSRFLVAVRKRTTDTTPIIVQLNSR